MVSLIARFRLYGWEDLELGERLRQMGVVLVRCPSAVGYHWHPPLSLEQVPRLIAVEGERAKMGLVFYKKHSTRRVQLIIQFTLLHRILWEVLTLGGLVNEQPASTLGVVDSRRVRPHGPWSCCVFL